MLYFRSFNLRRFAFTFPNTTFVYMKKFLLVFITAVGLSVSTTVHAQFYSVDNHNRRYKVKVITPHAKKKRHHFLVIPLLLSNHQSLTQWLPMILQQISLLLQAHKSRFLFKIFILRHHMATAMTHSLPRESFITVLTCVPTMNLVMPYLMVL